MSVTVDRRETLGIVGESGSGKTVLVRSIMGLLPPRNVLCTGRVWVSGTELVALKPRDVRQFWGREVAMVFQNPMTSLNPVRTVGAQIASPLRYHLKLSRSEARARAMELVRSVGIPDPVAPIAPVSASAFGRNAAARHDRHRAVLRTGPAAGR